VYRVAKQEVVRPTICVEKSDASTQMHVSDDGVDAIRHEITAQKSRRKENPTDFGI